MSIARIGAFCGLSVVMWGIVGCGGSSDRPATHPVSGSVIFNGKPVVGATVTFQASGAPRTATGLTDDQGSFQLSTFDTNDGAIEGEHKIAIAKAAPAGASDKMETPEDYLGAMQNQGKSTAPPGANAEGALPEKYSKTDTSGLSRTVVAGEENIFNFDLE